MAAPVAGLQALPLGRLPWMHKPTQRGVALAADAHDGPRSTSGRAHHFRASTLGVTRSRPTLDADCWRRRSRHLRWRRWGHRPRDPLRERLASSGDQDRRPALGARVCAPLMRLLASGGVVAATAVEAIATKRTALLLENHARMRTGAAAGLCPTTEPRQLARWLACKQRAENATLNCCARRWPEEQ